MLITNQKSIIDIHSKKKKRDFPGDPGVKTSRFHHREQVLIPGWGTRSCMSHGAAKKEKKENEPKQNTKIVIKEKRKDTKKNPQKPPKKPNKKSKTVKWQ